MRKMIVTDADKELTRVSFNKALDSLGSLSNKFEFTYELDKQTCKKAQLVFSRTAEEKIRALVQHFDTEVAWNGLVERTEEEGFPTYYVTDILVYPQQVTGATAECEAKDWDAWADELDDNTFNHLRLQGHSHVSMGVTPSSVDMHHQQEIVTDMRGDTYNIFIVCNKRDEMWIRIYDRKYNCVFDKNDIIISYESRFDHDSFIEEAESLVTEKKYKPQRFKYLGLQHEDELDEAEVDDLVDSYITRYLRGGNQF